MENSNCKILNSVFLKTCYPVIHFRACPVVIWGPCYNADSCLRCHTANHTALQRKWFVGGCQNERSCGVLAERSVFIPPWGVAVMCQFQLHSFPNGYVAGFCICGSWLSDSIPIQIQHGQISKKTSDYSTQLQFLGIVAETGRKVAQKSEENLLLK